MATKKTFKDSINPAMQFISGVDEPAQQESEQEQEQPKRRIISRYYKRGELPQEQEQQRETVTMAQSVNSVEIPEGYKVNYDTTGAMFIEKKSRRLQLLMQPSLYDAIKLEADDMGLSVNEYIHDILKQHFINEAEETEKQ